jgi:hypothetical protein
MAERRGCSAAVRAQQDPIADALEARQVRMGGRRLTGDAIVPRRRTVHPAGRQAATLRQYGCQRACGPLAKTATCPQAW